MLLWSGQTISEVGSAVTQIAIPILAVKKLHANTLETGLLVACAMAPFLLVSLPAGAWVDRWNRRKILIRCDFGRFALIGTIPIAYAIGGMTMLQLYIVSFLAGILTVFFDVAYQSYVPVLIPQEHLIDGNGKIGSSQSFAQFSGPALGGVLISFIGAAYSVIVDALSFLVSGFATLFITHREPPREAPIGERQLREEVKEGLRFVFGDSILPRIVGCTATYNFGSNVMAGVIFIFMLRAPYLHLSGRAVGLVFAIGAIGGIIGGLMASRIARRVGAARVIWVSVLISAPFPFFEASAQPGWGVLLLVVGLFAEMLTGVIYNSSQVSYRQAVCPQDMLGRMNASVRFIVWGTIPLGALVGGALGEAIGVRQTMYVGAVIVALSGAWVFFSPLRKMRDLPIADRAI
jgi:MFS family permease